MFKKKILLFSIIILVIIGLGTLGTYIFVMKQKAKTLKVTFYELDETSCQIIKDIISENFAGDVVYNSVKQSDFNTKKIIKNTDLFFSLEGSATDALKEKADTLPNSCWNYLPNSMKDKDKKLVPLFLNHFEVAYSEIVRSMAEVDYPVDFNEFEQYLEVISKKVFIPFFCAGGDDEVLYGLISCLVESFGGSRGYEKFLSALKESKNLNDILDFNFDCPREGKKADERCTLRAILDTLKTWPKKGYTHPGWMNGTKSDIEIFSERNQIGVLFMPLTDHRNVQYNIIRNFEEDRFPVYATKADHGLIAPSVCVLKLTNNFVYDDVIKAFLSEDNQWNISSKTQLAPVALRGQAYDKQADDVRFLAAACRDGAMPIIADSVFGLNKEEKHKFAEEVRKYLLKS